MKYLRQYIRNIISEASAEAYSRISTANKELKDKEMEALKTSSNRRNFHLKHSSMIDYPEVRHARRSIKRIWNEVAYGNPESAKFWKDPNKIICCHTLGWIEDGTLEGYFDHGGFYNPHGVNKDELSCIGLFNKRDFQTLLFENNNEIFIVLAPRRITFAYDGDAYTEELHHAGAREKQFHKSSGLPKRGSTLNTDRVLFDQEDIKERINSGNWTPLSRSKMIMEVTVDNWKLDTVYIPATHYDRPQGEALCKKLNIKCEILGKTYEEEETDLTGTGKDILDDIMGKVL
tara:strand:- start:59 stop:925 length:867 start_codon:yes stop_codon:yes gene_type:complete